MKRLGFLLALVSAALLATAVSPSAAQAGDLDCPDFDTQADAQNYFEDNGGSPSNNVDLLDADGDGIACEDNPCPCAGAGSGGGGGGGQGDKPKKPKQPRLPRLSKPAAKRFAKIALNRELRPWRAGTDKVLSCRKRRSRVRVKCLVRWQDDPVRLRGRVIIWFSRARGGYNWNYAWRIKHTNQACLDVGLGNCSGYYVVH